MGLPIDRSCPECGLPLTEALDQLVDPTASALPQLRNPARTGAALFGLTVLQLLVTVGLCVPAVLDRVALWRDAPPPPAETVWTPMAAAVFAILGVLAVFQLSLPRGGERDARVPVNLRLMAIGAVGVAGSVIARTIMEATLIPFEPRNVAHSSIILLTICTLSLTLTAAAHYYGFGQIVRIVGQRSREYRTSSIGRQRLRDMMAVILIFGAASLLAAAGDLFGQSMISRLATLIIWISVLMLLIGQVYLVVNAWWIRKAIHRPIPRLSDLIEMLPADPGPDDPSG